MKNYILNFEVTGCSNRCKHCYCYEQRNERSLMDVDEVISISKMFREQIDGNVAVYMLQEQTMYPHFIEMIKELKANGFMSSTNKGLLVTNGLGILYNKGLIDDISNHYSTVKMTLFGRGIVHDTFVNRKGHYSEIVEATRLCRELGLKVVWQLMLTNGNSNEIAKLIENAKEVGVDDYFVTAAFYYAGSVIREDGFIPLENDLTDVDYEVYEECNELFFPEYKCLELVDNISAVEINKTSLENLYIDSSFDVFPLNCIDPRYKLGNIKDDMDEITEMLNNRERLVDSVKIRNSLDIRSLINEMADLKSRQMHTPQTLFEKLVAKKLMS